MKKIFFGLAFFIAIITNAQKVTSAKKVLCNPIIIGNIPKKPLSVQYEFQSGFNMLSKNYAALPVNTSTIDVSNVQSFKLAYNKTIITKPKTYASIDVGYTNTKFNVGSTLPININPIPTNFNNTSFHSINASTNIFKPLSSKNFLIINLGLEANGNSASFQNFGSRNIFVTAAVIYGIKKSYNNMFGFGVLRAYRLGRVVHVPAFLWNKNFNKKWGL
jgi:hypothetical protein